MKKILIIAGEASSDMHAANLINDIKATGNDLSFFGLGGDKMKEAGADILENIVRLAFIGPGGLFKHYFTLRKIFHALVARLKSDPPDAAILIDYAEFNLRVAKVLKSLGVPIIYYVSPQVWAWGLWRINTIRELVDKMIVFFEFEESLYKKHGVDAVFVGHPLLTTVKTTRPKTDIIRQLNIEEGAKIVGLLPGSRESEIDKILPIMLESCKTMLDKAKDKKLEFILLNAPTIDESHIKTIVEKSGLKVRIVKEDTYNTINICDCAIVTSGTATLETALLNIPMSIIYKANFLTYILTKNLIKLPYIGLVNVVAGKKITPEFLQYDAKPSAIADYMIRLLTEEKLVSSIKSEYEIIRNSLGEAGASRRAAKEVLDFLGN